MVASMPAAFGRLCVETKWKTPDRPHTVPAAFGRLCVETLYALAAGTATLNQPPSGGCVLKPMIHASRESFSTASRLRAAVC